MIDIVNKDNSVIDHNAGNHNHSDKGDQRDGITGNEESQYHPNQGQRDTEDNGKGMDERFELGGHDHIDQKNG